jgi:hypothetical protein
MVFGLMGRGLGSIKSNHSFLVFLSYKEPENGFQANKSEQLSKPKGFMN